MRDPIHPVLLCGGTGTRLWPVSRKARPKQFAQLKGAESLFQQTARRFVATGFAPPLAVTAADYRFTVADQLAAVGVAPEAIVIEPEARNTAAAVCVAALMLAARDAQALMLVAPSDHDIPDPAGLRAAIDAARPAAESGALVCFGIAPERAETGYGWLRLAAPPDPSAASPCPLDAFVEKPARAEAEAFLAGGVHLWNAGLFLFTADAVLAAFALHAPEVLAGCRAALAGARADLGFTRLEAGPWSALPDISFDHAVMERAEGCMVMPYSGAWSDLGDWQAIWRSGTSDAQGLSTAGPARGIDCGDSLLFAGSAAQPLVGIGLKDVIAVALPDAVLVAHRDRAQEVRAAVEALRADGVAQAEAHARDHRPWGWFDCLARGPRYQVKCITVKPGGILSLQSHHHRAEHWIVVEGTATVTVGNRVDLVTENQSIYIPLGQRHRLENPGKLPLTLIEVQTGGYLGEDDIERHEDVYAREADVSIAAQPVVMSREIVEVRA